MTGPGTPPRAGTPAGDARLDYLDALRGLAAVLVASAHLSADLWLRAPQAFGAFSAAVHHLALDVVDVGKVGVVLFFAVSGFIIPHSLIGRRSGLPLPLRFGISRFFRLFPLYWLSIPLGLLLPWPTPGRTFDAATVAANFTMVQGFLGFENVIGAYWTLQIEMVFYACCLLMALAGLLSRSSAQLGMLLGSLFLALCVAAMRHLLDRKLPVALPLALSVMFFGCLWRSWLLGGTSVERRRALCALAAVTTALLPICVLAYSKDRGYGETWDRYVLSYLLAIGLFVLGTTRFRVRAALLVRLGVISYSVYLLHPIVFAAVERSGLHPLAQPAVGAAAYVFGTVVLTVLASEATYRLVEAPFVRFGRILAQWLAVTLAPRSEVAARARRD